MKLRKRSTVVLILLIAVSIVFVYSYLFYTKEEKVEEVDYGTLFSSLGVQEITPPVEALDFALKNLEGSEVSLKDFQGKVVFLNFWATWCGPCREEMPSMEKLWQRFKEKAFVILAVDLREGKEEVNSFMKDYGLTFSVLLDSKGEVGSMYAVRAIPTTFLIDSEGRIVGAALGARDWANEDALDLIEHLLLETKAG
ncbi:MAG TPA: TlpA family protein disulfide reductase [Candidatus Aminicenantes bacterium]|nr:TlpA family protein disulfide reductase [Candidatus Aminicenantes bacterium]